jgi:pimeloyl-ACP methyl ester carboxylesterase
MVAILKTLSMTGRPSATRESTLLMPPSGKAIKGSRIDIIPNCGHIPQLEQGATTLKLVLNFLRG